MTSSKPDKAGDFDHLRTRSGLDVFVLPTRKWKTKLVRLHVRAPQSERNAARALLPNLLRRGTRRLPNMVEVSRALEGLYGTIWSSSAYKLGDEQILAFRLETVEEKFLPGHPPLFGPALKLARELLYEPLLEGATFPAATFEQERLNHRRDIEAQYNDKLSWAFQRLLDEMFRGEPYGRPVLGTVAETDALTAESATDAHREVTTRLPMRAFAVGDFEPGEVVRFLEELVPSGASAAPAPSGARSHRAPATPRLLIEKEPVSQSKLVSGRMVDLANLSEREFDALRVYAGVLGGGFHSRLFQTVREKHSLAYFASSSLDRLRGVLYTSCGIDAAVREKVTALVEGEIASLRAAPVRADELEQTKNLIISGSRSMLDSPGGMVETLEANLATGRMRSLEQVCSAVAQVTAADVMAVAQRVLPPDVVYCLEGEARPEGA